MAEMSVIVTSYDSPQVLERCLSALSRQKEVSEIVVADCSRANPADELSPRFPLVRFLHFDEPRTVPRLRWAALPGTRGAIIGAIEARTVPAENWARRLLAAHEKDPDTPAVGGPVGPGGSSSAFDWGLYFCEYGAFAPPLPEGPATALSGANLSYKRSALQAASDLIEAGFWETILHERWLSEGKTLCLADARIEFFNTMSPATALRQRFNYGRGFAVERFAVAPAWRRWFWAATSPLLPAVLSWRTLSGAFRKGYASRALRALGWIAILTISWSAGEAAGYLLGTPGKDKIF